MKILILDHDGVICLADNWGGRFKKKGFDSNPETPLDIRNDDFDKKAVKILNEIVEETGCEIVTSSDWKRQGTLKQMQEMYITRGIKPPIGMTDFFKNLLNDGKVPGHFEFTFDNSLEIERSCEILHWLSEHPEVTHWVAVDDLDMTLNDSWGLENFVLTPRKREGIKQSGIKDKIIKFLK
jgi:hypothetical protein